MATATEVATESAVQMEVTNGGLPKQTIDLSVPNPPPQLWLLLYKDAGYRDDFHTWSLARNGGFLLFRLRLSGAIPVLLTLSACASLDHGKANCPIAITVNGTSFVPRYSDHDPNFHNVSWVIPKSLLRAGDNDIQVTLDLSATTQLFINAVTVEEVES
jgi:hypothetical protein